MGAVNDGTVAHVCAGFQGHGHAWEHVHSAVLLYVAAVLQNNAAPISAQRSTGADVAILADDHIAGNRRQWMHVTRWMYNWHKAFERVAGHQLTFSITVA